jgi:hypothetical protein
MNGGISMTLNYWKLKVAKFGRSRVCATALLSFTAGSLVAAGLAHIEKVSADSDRVFELRIYHTVPGKVPELESQFRDTTSKLLAKHNLNVVGYWVPEGTPEWDNTFIFLVAHSSLEEAKKNWGAMMADPEFQALIKSEQANKKVEKIDRTYMRPTDFSPLK